MRNLYRYVRDENRNPIAIIACIGPGQVGVSCCCKKDEFNKTLGKQIAEQRALKGKTVKIPDYRLFKDYRGQERVLADVVESVANSMKLKSLEWAKQNNIQVTEFKAAA